MRHEGGLGLIGHIDLRFGGRIISRGGGICGGF